MQFYNNMKMKLATVLSLLFIANFLSARENVNTPGSSSGDGERLTNAQKVLAGCTQGKTQTELKLNNVRTRILTCGDMWWDLNSNPKYEIPKGSGSYASFAQPKTVLNIGTKCALTFSSLLCIICAT